MENNKQITAVQWLAIQVANFPTIKNLQNNIEKLVEQAKEMEKQQIKDATIYGNRQEFYDGTEMIGKKYYQETFKK
jgi:hypothetical protein